MSRSQSAEERFDSRYKINTGTGCWEWTAGVTGDGYGCLRVNAVMQLAHRYSYSRFSGPIPEGNCVCHKCDNVRCVNPGHLFVGSHADNMRDMAAKGRNNQPKGERNGNARLTDAEASDILAMKGEAPAGVVAGEFGVSRSAINRIWSGQVRNRQNSVQEAV